MAERLHYGQFSTKLKQQNPNISSAEIEKQFRAQPGGSEYLDSKRTQLLGNAESSMKRQEENTRNTYGEEAAKKLAATNDTRRTNLQQSAQTWGVQYPTKTTTSTSRISSEPKTSLESRVPIAGTSSAGSKRASDAETKSSDNGSTSIMNRLREDRDKLKLQYSRSQEELKGAQKELGSVSGQVSDFASQLEQYSSQVTDLISSLNSQNNGLGDEVMGALDELAQSGFDGQIDAQTLKQIEQIALESHPQELEQNIKDFTIKSQQLSQEPQMQAQQIAQQPPIETPIPNKQQYKSLQQSGMTAQQIITQQPNLSNQIIPDGTIINPNTGVGLVQTSMGEAYQLPSGLVVPRDSSSGFYDVSALSAEDQKKLTYSDVLALDLSTQKTASDLKAYYNATTFQQMAKSNEREYNIAELQLDSFYNKENNRINEDQVKNMQSLELERMRQELSKETSVKRLREVKSQTANVMKAQMDAWGLEGSSAMLSSMSAHNLKFEQEASLITKTYDINIKELALASSNAEMAFTNRVTELNQTMEVQKLDLRNEYLNKKDEIDKSVLLSKIERSTELQNMHMDYTGKVYEANQQAQAAAAAAQKEAEAEMWEKQKYYSEQLGMLVSVDENGAPSPLLDSDGNPVQTMEGMKFTMEGEKFAWEQEKYAVDYDLRLQEFEQDQYEFGIDAEMRMEEFEFNREKFGMEYALKQDEQFFNQNLETNKFGLDNAKFGFDQSKYYDSLSQFDEITWDEDLGTYMGKGPGGLTDLGADFGKAGVAVPTKGLFEYSVSGPGEVRFDIPLGKKSSRGQCGQLVNDALFGGPGHIGDSFESKMKYSNSPTPVAGGAFFEKINGMWTGHTGLVEKVNPDGSFEIIESNYHGTEVVSRETVYPGSSRWNTIVENGGFYDPLKGGTSKRLGPAPGETEGIDGDFKTDAAGQSFAAALQADAENTNYQKLIEGKDAMGFADEINVINRKLSDSEAPLSQEIINKYVKDPAVRGAILAESRWIAAVLRKESGAAISQGEYLSMGTQYFPRAGDDEATLRMKEEARARKQAALLEQSGSIGKNKFESMKDSFSSTSSSYSTSSTPEAPKKGYFNGIRYVSAEEATREKRPASKVSGYSLPSSGDSYNLPDY